jgi:hypothetical protein
MTGYNPIANSANITAQGRGPAFAPTAWAHASNVAKQNLAGPPRPTVNSPAGGDPVTGVTGDLSGSVAPGDPSNLAMSADGAFTANPALLPEDLNRLQMGPDASSAPPTAQQATGIGAFGRPTLGASSLGQTGRMGMGASGFGNAIGNFRNTMASKGVLGGAFASGFGRR